MWKIPELGLKNATFQSSTWVGVSHSLFFPLAWASKPSHPYVGRCIIITPKERDCPGRIPTCRRDPERQYTNSHEVMLYSNSKSRILLFKPIFILYSFSSENLKHFVVNSVTLPAPCPALVCFPSFLLEQPQFLTRSTCNLKDKAYKTMPCPCIYLAASFPLAFMRKLMHAHMQKHPEVPCYFFLFGSEFPSFSLSFFL